MKVDRKSFLGKICLYTLSIRDFKPDLACFDFLQLSLSDVTVRNGSTVGVGHSSIKHLVKRKAFMCLM